MTEATIAEPSPGTRDRRVERSRRTIEFAIDALIRPGSWAAKIAYELGLQGRVRSRTHRFDLGRLARDAVRPTLRVAFAADFHAGATTDDRLLADACRALATFAPDLVLLGGDFVSVRASYIDRLAPLLAAVHAPLGKLAVLGNHDLRANRATVLRGLGDAGVRVLDNEPLRLPEPFDDVTICGISDMTRGDPRPDLAMDGATETRVVLMHSPETLRAIGSRAFDLALCGHTHGGQIALPWGAPVVMSGGDLNRRYASGLFDLAGEPPRRLLVTNGVGCSTAPVRLFAPPEVHLCLIT
jgi:predicted MPP superfamily phosphohydrolase